MAGTLYVIGVGPGDPELLTLKALNILNKISYICVPKGREEGSSLALSIVKKALNLDNKEVIETHFPMRKTRQCSETDNYSLDEKWNETVKIVSDILSNGNDVAFITIGDPSIYSTFFYLNDRLLEIFPALNIEMIPGVSSINASASRANISLGLADEKIAIIPATYSSDEIIDIIDKFDTIVLMKVHRVFGRVIKILEEMELLKNAIFVSRACMEGEKIFRDINNVTDRDLDYFSLMIIKK